MIDILRKVKVKLTQNIKYDQMFNSVEKRLSVLESNYADIPHEERNQVIFYGAGDYAQNNIHRWSGNGLIPICFIDNDENKFSTSHCGYEVLALAEAIKRYPNYELYITLNPEKYTNTTLNLIEYGIPQDRIKYAEPYEWRLGCDLIGKDLQIADQYFHVCCPIGAKDRDYFSIAYDNVSDALKKCEGRCEEIIGLHKQSISGPCEGCGYLIEKAFPINNNYGSIIFSSGFKGDLCNVRCVYCSVHRNLIGRDSAIDIKDVLVQLIKQKNGAFHSINFASGEFLARKDAEEILFYLSTKNVMVSLTSNASIFSEAFMKLINANKAGVINVSLDSGTRETYMKIKGRDYFDRVVSNLEKYASRGLLIDLKYIILPEINDNKADIDGFINIVERVNARLVYIASDMNNNHTPLPNHALDEALLLYKKARNRGFDTRFELATFNNKDSLFIQSRIRS